MDKQTTSEQIAELTAKLNATEMRAIKAESVLRSILPYAEAGYDAGHDAHNPIRGGKIAEAKRIAYRDS